MFASDAPMPPILRFDGASINNWRTECPKTISADGRSGGASDARNGMFGIEVLANVVILKARPLLLGCAGERDEMPKTE
jgi:hypothetical protein